VRLVLYRISQDNNSSTFDFADLRMPRNAVSYFSHVKQWNLASFAPTTVKYFFQHFSLRLTSPKVPNHSLNVVSVCWPRHKSFSAALPTVTGQCHSLELFRVYRRPLFIRPLWNQRPPSSSIVCVASCVLSTRQSSRQQMISICLCLPSHRFYYSCWGSLRGVSSSL